MGIITATILAVSFNFQKTAALIRHSNVVLDKTQRINAELSDAELDIRAFLTLHDAHYLTDYHQIRLDVMDQTARLKELVTENGNQERNANFIADDTTTWFSHLDRVADLAGKGLYHADDFQKSFSNILALKLSASTSLADFTSREQFIEEQRLTRLSSQWLGIEFATGLGLLASLSVAIFFGMCIRKILNNRVRALLYSASSLAEGKEIIGTSLQGDDEIAELNQYIYSISERLHEREATVNRYRILAEETSDIVLFLEGDVIVEANVAAAQSYGYSREKMRNMPISQIRVPERQDDFGEALDTRPIGDKRFETIHRRADGSRFPVEVAIRSTERDGKQLGAAIIRDISERKNAESAMRTALDAANRASRLKSQFVASMSHEIRTPLNAILGMSELLLRTNLDTEQAEYASTVYHCGEELLRTVNNVLDFSKMETGQLIVETSEFNLPHCIDSATRACMGEAQRKGLVLMTFVDPELPQLVLGDAEHLRRILVSLLDNAVKFTKSGHVSLSATLEHRTRHIIDVRLTVKDTGIGISPDMRERIFRPFLQGDSSVTRRFGGSGLGLAITRRLVELMTGSIEIESTEGVGTTASIRLQFNVAGKETQLELGNLNGKRALVADDDPLSREILVRYLRAWGLNVEEAVGSDVAAGLLVDRFARNSPYDIAFLDLNITRLDEEALLNIVDQVHRKNSPTRLVLTTAFDSDKRGERAVAGGCSAYIVKPIRQSQLFDCVSQILQDPVAGSTIPKPEEQPVSPTGKGRILVVEDNAVNQKLASRQLEKLGYTVALAENGLKALEHFDRAKFDLILMDCHMPEMDGFAATTEIRNRELRTGKRTPIIAMTADARTEDRIACLAADMDDYLAKPVSIMSLAQILERWLKQPIGQNS
jgi:PAS domain S-box-containing protein